MYFLYVRYTYQTLHMIKAIIKFQVPLQHCLDGETCNAHLKTCSKENVPECDAVTSKYRHTCEQVLYYKKAYNSIRPYKYYAFSTSDNIH